MTDKKSLSTKRVKGAARRNVPSAVAVRSIRLEGRPDALYVFVDDVEVASQPLNGKYFEVTIQAQDIEGRRSEVREMTSQKLATKAAEAAKTDAVEESKE